jgi:hypothetical protein
MIKYGTYKLFKNKDTEEIIQIPLTEESKIEEFSKKAEWVEESKDERQGS